jgi:diacylglycerol kinase family enzyme
MAADEREIPMLANVASGRSGDAAAARIRASSTRLGLAVEVQPTNGGDIGEAVRRLLSEGRSKIPVAGGDGTLTSAANQLAGTGTTLVPVPIGTLNHFARKLRIESPEMGLQALVDGEVREVPFGVLDDRIFLNTATIGLYAEVVLRREKLRPFLLKWPAAVVAFTTLLVRNRTVQVTLEVDGEQLQRETCLVWAGVGWGSFPRAHEATEQRSSPDLEIAIVKARTRLSMMVLMARLLWGLVHGGRPFSAPGLEIFHTRQLTIHTSHRRVGVTLDGEVSFHGSPLFVAMQDRGLLVLVPRGATESGPDDAVQPRPSS